MATPEKIIRRESLVLRVLWMLLFLLVWQVAVPLLGILAVAQLLYRLFYGAPSAHFMNFGDSLSQYLAQIGRFAVFHSDEKPWPMADWPQARAADGEAAHTPKSTAPAADPVNTAAATVAPAESTPDTEHVSDVSDVSDVSEGVEAVDVVGLQDTQAGEDTAVTLDQSQPAEPKL